MKRTVKLQALKPGMLVEYKTRLSDGRVIWHPMLIVRVNSPRSRRGKNKRPFWGKGIWSVVFFSLEDRGWMGPGETAPGNRTTFRVIHERGTAKHKAVCDDLIDRQCDVIVSAETNCDLLREYRDRK